MQCDAFIVTERRRCEERIEKTDFRRKLQYCEEHRMNARKLYSEYKKLEEKKWNCDEEVEFLRQQKFLGRQLKILLKRNEFDTYFTPEGKPDSEHERYFEESKELYHRVLERQKKRPERTLRKIVRYEGGWTVRPRRITVRRETPAEIPWVVDPNQVPIEWPMDRKLFATSEMLYSEKKNKRTSPKEKSFVNCQLK